MTEEKEVSLKVSRTTHRYMDHVDPRRRSHESHTSEHETVNLVTESLGEREEQNDMHVAKRIKDEIKFLSHGGNVGEIFKRTSATSSKFSLDTISDIQSTDPKKPICEHQKTCHAIPSICSS